MHLILRQHKPSSRASSASRSEVRSVLYIAALIASRYNLILRRPLQACEQKQRLSLFGMHKDKPPGLFDFAERSVRYLVGFWFTAGLVLSLVVHTGMLVTRADAKGSGPKENAETLEVKAASHKPPGASTQPPTTAVRY